MKYLKFFESEFLNSAIKQTKDDITDIEDYFLEIMDNKSILFNIGSCYIGKNRTNSKRRPGYRIEFSTSKSNLDYVKNSLPKILKRLRRDYNILYKNTGTHYSFVSDDDTRFSNDTIKDSVLFYDWRFSIQKKPIVEGFSIYTSYKERYPYSSIEEIEDYFLSLMDHKNSDNPIDVHVGEYLVNTRCPVWGYKISIVYDMYDQVFVDREANLAKKRLKRDYNIHYSQISKRGNGYTTREISVYGTNDTRTVDDPKWKWTITISNKREKEISDLRYRKTDKINAKKEIDKLNESNQNDSTLIIVDIQKSFKKFFTDNYVKAVQEYAKKFKNVIQIFDNHHEGKNPDVDYLYDKNPDIEDTSDLYKFKDDQQLVEKRYNYNVNVDFYKKILDEKTYKESKEKENRGSLKIGNFFHTKEGTIIVYIGNNHVWYHVPKKLYNLFLKLKGKEITLIGGSDQECALDIEISAKSLGVIIKKDFRYIYSAKNCPIK